MTAAEQYAPTFPPGHPEVMPAPEQPVAPAPPGMAWTADPQTGERHLTYAPPPQPEPLEQPPPTPVPDRWPRRMVAGGLSAAAVIAATGYAAPGLAQVGHAVEMGGVGVGVAAAGVGAVAVILKGALGRSERSGNQSVNVNVSVESTASVFGRRR